MNVTKVKQVKGDTRMSESDFHFHLPRWENLPDIELYLDQVIKYLEDHLDPFFVDKTEKIITKAMVNNYVKHGVLTPPVKKKYGKSHLAQLFVISLMKQVYSINDIKVLIRFALGVAAVDVSYNKFCDVLEESIECIFSNKAYISEEPAGKSRHLLKCATQSYANKLYVQSVYLSGRLSGTPLK